MRSTSAPRPRRRSGWPGRARSAARTARPRFPTRARPLSTSSRASESISCRRLGDLLPAWCGAGRTASGLRPGRSGNSPPRASTTGVWPGGGVKTRFSTWPSAKTSTTSARSAAEADKFDMPDRRFVLGRQHEAGAAGDARQRRADLVEQASPRPGRSRPAWRRSSRDPRVGDGADLQQAVDEHPQAQPGSGSARPRYAGCPAGPGIPDPASRCGSSRR